MQRRVKTQNFFDQRRTFRRREGLDRLRTFEQGLNAVAEGVDRRLMAGIEEQNASRDEFGFAQSALLRMRFNQLANEIIARRPAPRFDKVAQKSSERARGGNRAVLNLARHAELIHRHHCVRPLQQVAPL